MATRKNSSPPTRKSPPAPAGKGTARAAAGGRERSATTASVSATARAREAAALRRTARRQPETLRLRSIAPALTCDDLERSIDFYVRGLGFVVSQEWVRDGRRTGVMLRAGACELGLAQDDWAKGRDRAKGAGARLYLETAQEVDRIAARLAAAGAKLTSPPKTSMWAAREFSVDDPDGFHLTIFEALKKKGG